jgi:hypothetical protein
VTCVKGYSSQLSKDTGKGQSHNSKLCDQWDRYETMNVKIIFVFVDERILLRGIRTRR